MRNTRPLDEECDITQMLEGYGWPKEWAVMLAPLEPSDRRELILNMREYASGGKGYTTVLMTNHAAALFEVFKPTLREMWYAPVI